MLQRRLTFLLVVGVDDILRSVVVILFAVAVVGVVGIVSCRTWCTVLCPRTGQCSNLIPRLCRLAMSCVVRPLMRWVPDGRCPFWYVDRGVAWRWGNDCPDDRRRIHMKNSRIDCCVFLVCWKTFLPCGVPPCYVERIVVVGEVVCIVVSID